MASNERIKKYLEAGTVLGQVTRARAEEIVKELVAAGDIQRGQAQEWVDNLIDRSRRTSEQVLELVRHEVSTQLSRVDTPALEAIASQVADILHRSADAGRAATAEATKQASETAAKTRKAVRHAADRVTPGRGKDKKKGHKKSGAHQTTSGQKAAPPKKSTAKKAAAKKTAAKKTAAKKSTAKKAAPAKKTPAKKTTMGGSST
jgi:polyhydroxyalkanoate synthesis regulator phasin